MTHKEQLKALFEHYNLIKEDTFVMQKKPKNGPVIKIPIITRTGIEKIQAHDGILVTYDIINISADQKTCTIKAVAEMPNTKGEPITMQSYGEVNPDNCKNQYPVMTCEKRALGRVVLKLAGFYSLGVFSEDENLDVVDR